MKQPTSPLVAMPANTTSANGDKAVPAYPIPANEPKRLEKLAEYHIMHSGQEVSFDRITELVKAFFKVPVVAITFLDEKEQFFKSINGYELTSVPRPLALCNYTLVSDTAYIVTNTKTHRIFKDHVLTKNPPFMRFYAGVPLVIQDKGERYALGTLCLVDIIPHKPFTPEQIKILQQFGEMVVEALELRQKQYLAKRANAVKSDFLANMSHEIRTPMSGIMGMLDLMRRTTLDNQQRAFVNSMYSSSEHLLSIMNDILDLSKVEAGEMRLEKSPSDLPQICQEVIDIFQVKAQEKNITVTLDYANDMPKHVLVDPVRIKQILTNLINNAIKFTPRTGSVVVKASQILPAQGQDDPPFLCLQVIDTGIGIRPEAMAVIFDAYNQADKFTHRLYGGTGLGLSVCKSLVEKMGGTIAVQSRQSLYPDEPEQTGSVFTFTIPLEIADTPALPQLPHRIHAQEWAGERKFAHILLVEDDRVNAIIAKKMLARNGYDTTWVKDGQQAVDTFSESPHAYQLILMDHQMPIMDGIEATKILKKKFAKLPPIIAVTAHAMHGDKELYLRAGMQDYCTKPYKPAQLDSMIQYWLHQAETENKP